MMDIRTYRAKNMREALRLVREDLGPQAALLDSRAVRRGMLRWFGPQQIEVTASNEIDIPSRWPERKPAGAPSTGELHSTIYSIANPPSHPHSAAGVELIRNAAAASNLNERETIGATSSTDRGYDNSMSAMRFAAPAPPSFPSSRRIPPPADLSRGLFDLFTELVDDEVPDDVASDMIHRLGDLVPAATNDSAWLRQRLLQMVEDDLETCGPIRVDPHRTRLIALVGATGVGKTTTVAKLAANFRLQERLRVGLVTLDTFRIAAVEQLRTYAEIIDLPMEVASDPSEIRAAIERLAGLDLILMDTAGRSPLADEPLADLQRMLCEANPDETHLVVSAAANVPALHHQIRRFTEVGATALIATKLDETRNLAHLWPVLRDCRLPLSYVTHGQNVPDDIETADPRRAAFSMIGGTRHG